MPEKLILYWAVARLKKKITFEENALLKNNHYMHKAYIRIKIIFLRILNK
jgi:hypothetical protein